MSDFLSNFRDVLEHGNDLPTLPTVVFELHGALDNENASDRDIATIIERDPAMATRLLRLANSAAFNRGHPVGAIGQAIQVLGLRQIRALCVALAVVNAFTGSRGGLAHRSFWRHSAGVALLARELAACLGFRHVPVDQLYLGGLLHDVGLLILDQYFPDQMKRSLAHAQVNDAPLAAVEESLLGADHGEIGGLLLGRWSLPAGIVAMVSAHHHPTQGPVEHRDACWLIHTAEVMSHGNGLALALEGVPPERAAGMTQAIREADFAIDDVLEELPDKAGELAAALG